MGEVAALASISQDGDGLVPLDCPLEGFDGQIGTLAGAPDGEEPQGADIEAVEVRAAMVTTAPLRLSMSSNSGMAVISLVFSPTNACARVIPASQAQALTACRWVVSPLRLPRKALPSMAIWPPSMAKPRRARCSAMHAANAVGSMAWKTREKVLAQGMPLGSLSHLQSQSSRSSPNSSMSS